MRVEAAMERAEVAMVTAVVATAMVVMVEQAMAMVAGVTGLLAMAAAMVEAAMVGTVAQEVDGDTVATDAVAMVMVLVVVEEMVATAGGNSEALHTVVTAAAVRAMGAREAAGKVAATVMVEEEMAMEGMVMYTRHTRDS